MASSPATVASSPETVAPTRMLVATAASRSRRIVSEIWRSASAAAIHEMERCCVSEMLSRCSESCRSASRARLSATSACFAISWILDRHASPQPGLAWRPKGAVVVEGRPVNGMVLCSGAAPSIEGEGECGLSKTRRGRSALHASAGVGVGVGVGVGAPARAGGCSKSSARAGVCAEARARANAKVPPTPPPSPISIGVPRLPKTNRPALGPALVAGAPTNVDGEDVSRTGWHDCVASWSGSGDMFGNAVRRAPIGTGGGGGGGSSSIESMLLRENALHRVVPSNESSVRMLIGRTGWLTWALLHGTCSWRDGLAGRWAGE